MAREGEVQGLVDVTKGNRPPDGEEGSRGRKGAGREEAWIGRGRKNRAKRIIQQVSLAPLCRLTRSPLGKKRAKTARPSS